MSYLNRKKVLIRNFTNIRTKNVCRCYKTTPFFVESESMWGGRMLDVVNEPVFAPSERDFEIGSFFPQEKN